MLSHPTQTTGDPYHRLATENEGRRVVDDFIIPAEHGRGFVLHAGQILRITTVEGPQSADFNAWNLEDPKEMFWSGRTRILQKVHLTTGHQLWSTPPKMRPMLTIIADTVEQKPHPHGAASHDLLYSRCNRRLYEVVWNEHGHRNCQDNMAEAIAPYGLTPDYVHDAFNIFTVSGINDEGRLFFLEPDAKKGDYVELYAEMDCIIAVSACPGHDCNGPINKPLGITIYDPPVGLRV